jgi:hypothetical protein
LLRYYLCPSPSHTPGSCRKMSCWRSSVARVRSKMFSVRSSEVYQPLSHTHTHRERERYIYIYINTQHSTHTTHTRQNTHTQTRHTHTQAQTRHTHEQVLAEDLIGGQLGPQNHVKVPVHSGEKDEVVVLDSFSSSKTCLCVGVLFFFCC